MQELLILTTRRRVPKAQDSLTEHPLYMGSKVLDGYLRHFRPCPPGYPLHSLLPAAVSISKAFNNSSPIGDGGFKCPDGFMF